MERTRRHGRATAVRQELGYDGSGVAVAIIDSGASVLADDLTDGAGTVAHDGFVDFVTGATTPYDEPTGHGTHVAGIVSGNGMDSGGARTGIAPGAHLLVLKVLDASGIGRISDVIAAIDYAITQKDALHIGVINLSVATGVYESYNLDPLTLAAKRAVTAGIVVVAAAGNNGRSKDGHTQYAGVTAPGNAPLGADRRRPPANMGTVDRIRRHHRRVQLARPECHRLRRETGSGRARRRHRISERARERLLYRPRRLSAARNHRHAVSAVFEPERHQHVRARRQPAPSR